MKGLCKECFYIEFCEKDNVRERSGVCEFFFSEPDDDTQEELVETYVECGRSQYRDAWFDYIKDFD